MNAVLAPHIHVYQNCICVVKLFDTCLVPSHSSFLLFLSPFPLHPSLSLPSLPPLPPSPPHSPSPGPVAPLHWIRDCILSLVPEEGSSNRKKLLVGMNFYGYDFSSAGMEGTWLHVQWNSSMQTPLKYKHLLYSGNSVQNYLWSKDTPEIRTVPMVSAVKGFHCTWRLMVH